MIADWGAPPGGDWDDYALLCEGALRAGRPKTAMGAMRYARGRAVCAVDSELGPGFGVPVVGTVREARDLGATSLLMGIVPRGGALPASMRAAVAAALEAGLHVASGLHTQLSEDAGLTRLSRGSGAVIWDLRAVPRDLPIATGARSGGARVLLTVGTDCHAGKMTAALELHRAALERGAASAFVPTGQTGIFIERWGVAVDRVPGDFMAGVTEAMIRHVASGRRWVWVEGQGSLFHPAYSGVSLALAHGALADAMILCHEPGRARVDGFSTVIPSLSAAVRRHEEAAAWVRPARVIGIALMTARLGEAEARAALEAATRETGLPAADPLRFGVEPLLAAAEAMG